MNGPVTNKTCMLAKTADLGAIPVGAVMEVKLDGHRMIADTRSGNVRLYARSGVDKTHLLPHIVKELEAFPPGLFDGEVCGDGWSQAQHVLGSNIPDTAGELSFVIFDCLSLMGEDIRKMTLATRRSYLEYIFSADGSVEGAYTELAEQVPYDPELILTWITSGHEGAIIKDPASEYVSNGRGKGWWKVKNVETIDVVVIGAKQGKGRLVNQVGALIFGAYIDDGWVELGTCSGMTDEQRENFTRRIDGQYAGTNMLGEVIEVQHMGRMPSGGFRHPQFKRHRTDKKAEDCLVP